MDYACVVVAELVEVYEGFGDREVKGSRMVACGGVCVYIRGEWEIEYAHSVGMRISQ